MHESVCIFAYGCVRVAPTTEASSPCCVPATAEFPLPPPTCSMATAAAVAAVAAAATVAAATSATAAAAAAAAVAAAAVAASPTLRTFVCSVSQWSRLLYVRCLGA